MEEVDYEKIGKEVLKIYNENIDEQITNSFYLAKKFMQAIDMVINGVIIN